jgi:hypothetical protein
VSPLSSTRRVASKKAQSCLRTPQNRGAVDFNGKFSEHDRGVKHQS